MPIDSGREEARAALERVPLWFRTFSLNGAGVYTPGIARDHRYRLRAILEDLTGARVLDVGAFDGFYAFLAERCEAARVVAVDNEQYAAWIRRRFGIDLGPGAGFRAIAELLGSGVEYRRLDALGVDRLGARRLTSSSVSASCTALRARPRARRRVRVFWGFSRSSLDRLGRLGGVRGFELVDAPEIAGHPRIIGTREKG